MPDLSAFSSLRLLELSYNAIHSLAPLKACGATRLEELYAASNKISEAGFAATVLCFRAQGLNNVAGLCCHAGFRGKDSQSTALTLSVGLVRENQHCSTNAVMTILRATPRLTHHLLGIVNAFGSGSLPCFPT